MAGTDHERRPHQFLQSLRRHVLTPLSTADRILERERTEVTAERDAFEAFVERLATITPETEPAARVPSPAVAAREPVPDRIERVRAAYRETVMSVAHYDDVYGESLAENAAAEFGPDLAEGLRGDRSVPFTRLYKNALRTAAAGAVQERRVFIDVLHRESQSIERARTELTDLIAELDTTIIPEWYQETFADRLDRVATERQKTLRTRQSLPSIEDHGLCTYLYERESWSYPVLTSVTRVHETVVL